MEIIKILRKNMPLFVKQIKVGELDKTKCSTKFLSHNLDDDVIVNVKCYEDGTLDLRGKKGSIVSSFLILFYNVLGLGEEGELEAQCPRFTLLPLVTCRFYSCLA